MLRISAFIVSLMYGDEVNTLVAYMLTVYAMKLESSETIWKWLSEGIYTISLETRRFDHSSRVLENNTKKINKNPS